MSVRNRRRMKFLSPHQRGFTLIEIMVVMVIVGIIVAIALLSLGTLGNNRDLETEARKLSTLLQLANDDATVQGRDFGLEVMLNGYRFVEFDPLLNTWFEVIGDDLMRERTLAEGLEFELTIEEHRVLLLDDARQTERDEDEDENPNDRDLTDDYLPHILILSSGDTSPFELLLVRNRDRIAERAEVKLTMSAAGELIIGEEDADAI